MTRTLLLVTAAALAAATAGCLTDQHPEPAATALDLSEPKLARGQRVFYQQCHMCHPHGGAGLGPALVNKPLPKLAMKFQVRHGLGAMPRFPDDKISDEDVDAVIDYIHAVHATKSAPGVAP